MKNEPTPVLINDVIASAKLAARASPLAQSISSRLGSRGEVGRTGLLSR